MSKIMRPKYGFNECVHYVDGDFTAKYFYIEEIKMIEKGNKIIIVYSGNTGVSRPEDLLFTTKEDAVEAICKKIKGD